MPENKNNQTESRLVIRTETPQDYDAVYHLVKEAFATAEHSDGHEQDLVEKLRKSTGFVPELSIIAVLNDQIAGHIMFTEIKVGHSIQLALAPLSVLPEYQRQGIGARLIAEGHKRAKKLGYEYSVLIGHPSYYPKFGYVDAAKFGILAPFELPKGVFMAYKLQPEARMINTKVIYPEEFFS